MTMMTTVGLLDGCQCRCEWEEDGTAKMTLISTDKNLAWHGVLGKDLLEDKVFRKKVAGEEDASDKVKIFNQIELNNKLRVLGSSRCANKCF